MPAVAEEDLESSGGDGFASPPSPRLAIPTLHFRQTARLEVRITLDGETEFPVRSLEF